jgi:hypothetical protein
MQKYLPIIIVVVVAAAGAGVLLMKRGAGPAGEIQVLEVSGPTEEIPEGASWGIYVKASAAAPGTYTLRVSFAGDTFEQEVTFEEAGESTFYIGLPGRVVGSYTYSVGGIEKTVTFRPLKPAQFEVVSLAVPEENIPINKSVVVKATVRNVGEQEGPYSGTIQVGSVSKSIPTTGSKTIKPGTQEELSATLTPTDLQNVLGGKQSDVVKVKLDTKETPLSLRQPNPATCVYLSIQAPKKAYVNQQITVYILVRNEGDLEGKDMTLEAQVGGETKTTTRTLEGGQEFQWELKVTPSSLGTLTISAGGLTASVEVVQQPAVRVESIDVPVTAVSGDKIKVKALLKNAGDSGWTGQFDVYVSGPESKTLKTPQATLKPGESVPVATEFTLTKYGIYTVSVEDKSATVRVLRPTETNTPPKEEPKYPGDASVYETDYYYEIPIINYKVTKHYYSATWYKGVEDYAGYRCMKWQTLDVQNPQAYYEYFYMYITPDEKESRQVGTVHYETTQSTIISFDPPAKNWTWPASSFTGDWSNYSMVIKTKFGGQEYTLEISGKARFRVELKGTQPDFPTKWGSKEEVQVVTVYTDIGTDQQPATIKVAGMTGTARGTLKLTRYMGKEGSLREEADSKIDFTVGVSSSMIIKYTSDMLCYRNYWVGTGGDPSYFKYLPS